jgi:hypothetical protein
MGGSCGPILENGTEFKLSQVHDFDASAESEAFYPVQAVQDPSHSWVISDSEYVLVYYNDRHEDDFGEFLSIYFQYFQDL